MRITGSLGNYVAAAAFFCILLGLLSPAPAHAQGAFYVEIPKEGRIYVFNNMAAYEEFKSTGEMGKSITRIGAGPKGETLVFDSEEAIHLYNFKHDLPGEVMTVQEETKPRMKFGWKDGKTTFESDNAKLVISNRVQIRFTNDQLGDEDTKGSFSIRRAKTKFAGWIYTPDLEYELQANWSDATGELEDAMVNYDVTHGRKAFQIKGGQFKVPFGRQELTSSGSQEFVDRSIVSAAFATGRDIGLQLWGQTPKGRVEWRTGMFNGNGRLTNTNDNSRYQYDARVTWQPFGDVKYSESDFESKDKPLVAFAADYQTNNRDDNDPNTDRVSRAIWGTDFVFKFKGIAFFSEYFMARNEPELTPDFDSTGFHAQLGYFVFKRYVEIAVRYATIDPSDQVADDHIDEKAVTLNWFMNKHNLKLQATYRQIKNQATDITEDQGLLQFQFIF